MKPTQSRQVAETQWTRGRVIARRVLWRLSPCAARMVAAVAFLASACRCAPQEEKPLSFVLCCQPESDLVQVPSFAADQYPRAGSVAEAIAEAPEGSAVLILADQYPAQTTDITPEELARTAAKHLRLYIEYPAALPGIEFGEPRQARWERGVVSSGFFGEALPELSLLTINDCRFLPVKAERPHLVLARVAGYDKALFGLPEESWPILFEHPQGDILVATTKLSQFITGRYGPTEAWRHVWEGILRWLCRGQDVPTLNWTSTVHPSYPSDQSDQPLPDSAETQAFLRGVEWFRKSGMLATSSEPRELAVPADSDSPGSHGVHEGYGTRIRWDGTQDLAPVKRSDCNGEVAMGLAFGGEVAGEEAYSKAAANVLDYWFAHTVAQQGKRADPEHPAFGLVAWGITNWDWEKAFYGDDNARLLLGTLASAALLETNRWDEAALRCLLANLRTTGRYGFRENRIDLPQLEANGWRPYFEGAPVSYSPHYQAYLWACYLWAYRATGYELFLRRAEQAIAMTMAVYPDGWLWTNGIAQERARMLLPLAWLVRVNDTPEHRQWLRRVAEDLLRLQQPCGAIREELGTPGMGAYGPPPSNEAYGTGEATLVQQNGDPVCDLLYTTNFAFLGLHEAAAATGEALYADAEEKLAKFLCRIQVRSERHPELDGGWFRAFDYDKWDYWGSSSDHGWGAWSIESGWTQGWITAVLGMRQMKISFWELTEGSEVGRHLPKLKPLFFPEGDELPGGETVEHLALAKPVKSAKPCDPRYPGGGDRALTDGRLGRADHRDPAWQGYWNEDLDATLDLGEVRPLSEVSLHCLQSIRVGVFLPQEVEFALSDDGETFRIVATVANDVPNDRDPPFTHEFLVELEDVSARYVRVRAKAVGVCPNWHAAKGQKAWLFVDEVVVR